MFPFSQHLNPKEFGYLLVVQYVRIPGRGGEEIILSPSLIGSEIEAQNPSDSGFRWVRAGLGEVRGIRGTGKVRLDKVKTGEEVEGVDGRGESEGKAYGKVRVGCRKEEGVGESGEKWDDGALGGYMSG